MISDDRVMGFVEGEGCFNITIRHYLDDKPRKTGRKNNVKKSALPVKVLPTFRVVCAERDREMLEKIREKLGVGRIYHQNRQKQKNCQDIAHYCVGGVEELLKVKEFFEHQTFYTTKGKDFRLWASCLDLIFAGKHKTKDGILEICKIRENMNVHGGKTSMLQIGTIREKLEENPEHITAHKPQTTLIST